MAQQTEAELKLAELLIEVLNLEDIEPAEIAPNDALFDEGLGLDSIDALEISLAVSQQYNVELKAEIEGVREAFATLATLSSYIENHRT